MNICERFEQLISIEGVDALQQDEELKAHGESCEACTQFLLSATELQQLFTQASAIEPPPALVSETLAAIDARQQTEQVGRLVMLWRGGKRIFHPSNLAWTTAAAAILFAVLLPLVFVNSSRESRSVADQAPITPKRIVLKPPPEANYKREETGDISELEEDALYYAQPAAELREALKEKAAKANKPMPDLYANEPEPVVSPSPEESSIVSDEWEIGIPELKKQDRQDLDFYRRPNGRSNDSAVRVGQVGVEPPIITRKVAPKYPQKAVKIRLSGYVILSLEIMSNGNLGEVKVIRGLGKGRFGFEGEAIRAVKQWEFIPGNVNGKPANVRLNVKVEFSPQLPVQTEVYESDEEVAPKAKEHEDPKPPQGAWLDFMEQYQRVDHLQAEDFKAATGYWANTYVPGDPYFRNLQRRLNQVRTVSSLPLTGMDLEQHASQVLQPYDAPRHAAMALYVQANHSAVSGSGPQRLLLQVGLKGADQHGTRRPNLEVAVVWDLEGDISPQAQASFEGLLLEMSALRDFGDHFSLFVSGHGDQPLISADQFRHGPLSLVSQQVFGKQRPQGSLADSLTAAATYLQQGEENTGNKAIFLVTADHFKNTEKLTELAHLCAMSQVKLSVFGVGDGVSEQQINQVVLAGHGNRRFLEHPAQAKAVVDREFKSASRVIARALRLRIRLAADVKLIDILGSHSLDETSATRIRAAEKAVDVQLAKQFGITADRGEDEDGIQIVIPSFLSGDDHVFLLDLLVPGPGQVADVNLRYKDLIQVRNGVASDSFSLSNQPGPETPLEHNVSKNFLAHQTRLAMEQARTHFQKSYPRKAVKVLEDHHHLVTQAMNTWGTPEDTELLNDLHMLRQYIVALQDDAADRNRQFLADSMKFAALAKTWKCPIWE